MKPVICVMYEDSNESPYSDFLLDIIQRVKFTDLRDTRHQRRSLPSCCCSVDCLCQCSSPTVNLTSSHVDLGKCNTSSSSSTDSRTVSVLLHALCKKAKMQNGMASHYADSSDHMGPTLVSASTPVQVVRE